MPNKVYMFIGQESYVDNKRVISVEVCQDTGSQFYGDIVSVGDKELDWMLFKDFDCINAIITEQGNRFEELPYDSGEINSDLAIM